MRRSALSMESAEISCPSCGSDAFYRYGRSKTGKQRFICLVCLRQFSSSSPKDSERVRPKCPNCGRIMHLYMRDGDVVRFRCSRYPHCRTFIKVPSQEEK